MLGFPVKGDEKHEYNRTKILMEREENLEASRALLPGNLEMSLMYVWPTDTLGI